jgi:hypothetical protein
MPSLCHNNIMSNVPHNERNEVVNLEDDDSSDDYLDINADAWEYYDSMGSGDEYDEEVNDDLSDDSGADIAVEGEVLNNNTSALRLVVIRGDNSTCHLLFRCEENHRKASWFEKLFCDAIRQQESWATRLNFSQHFYHWHHRDVPQFNQRGYPIRMFHIPLSIPATDFTIPAALQMCRHICNMLGSYPSTRRPITFDERTLFWLQPNAVWSEVIGTRKSLSMIHAQKGAPYQGYYEEHEEFLLTYFHDRDGILYSHFFRAFTDEDSYGTFGDDDDYYEL